MTTNNNGAIVTKDSITAVIDGAQHTVTRDNVNFDRAMQAARTGDWEAFIDVISPVTALVNFGNGRVRIEDGYVYFNGEIVHNVITDRMLELASAGFDVDPIANFMANLNQNPSKQAVDELYLFLEANNLAITPDGHFLAYKRVSESHKDLRTGTFDNSVGSVVEMPRNAVDDVRDHTCSSGLHFCSLEYLQVFRGDRIVLVKANPRDVVSIPSDYNNAKGRTCRYEVVGETESDKTSAFSEPVMDMGKPTIEPIDYKSFSERAEVYGSADWAIKQAHVMAHDNDYRIFIGFVDDYEGTIEYIRDVTSVESTTEYRTNQDALDDFILIYERYHGAPVVAPDGNSKESLSKRALGQARDALGHFIKRT